MKCLILISILVLNLSCKKMNTSSGGRTYQDKIESQTTHEAQRTNELTNEAQLTNEPQKKINSFLSFSYKENHSLLRKKLMVIELSKILKQEDTHVSVQAGDEFLIEGGNYYIDQKTTAEYESLKESSVELVISFKNHLEIYFLPSGLSRAEALEKITILNDEGANLYWSLKMEGNLIPGKAYYILSSTEYDILASDND